MWMTPMRSIHQREPRRIRDIDQDIDIAVVSSTAARRGANQASDFTPARSRAARSDRMAATMVSRFMHRR